MGTLASVNETRTTGPSDYRADQAFFLRYSIVLSLSIVVGFVQYSLRGLTDIASAPDRVYVHASLMTLWLITLVAQNRLALSGNIALHRKIGKAAAVLVAAIVVAGLYTSYMAVADHRPSVPSPGGAYLLALTSLNILAFAAVVIWAMKSRRDTQAHRRLMLGATIVLTNAAFGRFAPADWPDLAVDTFAVLCQLCALSLLAIHDAKMLGHTHWATKSLAVLVVAITISFRTLYTVPAFASFANAIAG